LGSSRFSPARRGGIRNLDKKFASIARLSRDSTILDLAGELLGGAPHLVRALFFDKTPEQNWFVTWHQDRTVALNEKAELDGWGPWSIKEDVWHVQPPQAVLNRMLTLRLHLDPADEHSGCLKVIPGTHRFGILQQARPSMVSSDPTPQRLASCLRGMQW
jgi:Phytanoyl-CoA dioxygenase (PhyH)